MATPAPSPDPRVGLKSGWFDAGEASWNLKKISSTKPSDKFLNAAGPTDSRLWNSDLAFASHYVYQGNFSGYQVWDIADPAHPRLAQAYVCPASQTDVSVFHNLLFTSAEDMRARKDCGLDGVADTVSQERVRGVRIFDITDVEHPKYIGNVQTCRGSHTHTLVQDLRDPGSIYIYISGSAGVRSPNELEGCSGLSPEQDSKSELFRIEVIQVPLAHPEQAHVVSKPAILADLAAAQHHGELPADIAARNAAAAAGGRGGRGGAPGAGGGVAPQGGATARGPVQCHDITVYPQIGLAGGACGGYGVLLDVTYPAQPRRLGAAADSNFSFWHSATFNNDGTKVLFTDEWGGGTQPRCRPTDKPEWGADAIFTIDAEKRMTFHSYFKMPAPQTATENCVAHNGSLIPIPGRDIMTQGWYQGGLDVFDFTDPDHPKEIAYFDRGPIDANKLDVGGYWSSYWYNGYIIGSEIARGLDIFELKPSPYISQNEIDAAKLVHFEYLNVQDQPKLVWPASFVVARAFIDQLARSNGLSGDRLRAVSSDLANAEKASGGARSAALTKLATQLDSDASGSPDSGKVRMLAAECRRLAGA
jgi:hypothetical protein